jgi:hypothetical protein
MASSYHYKNVAKIGVASACIIGIILFCPSFATAQPDTLLVRLNNTITAAPEYDQRKLAQIDLEIIARSYGLRTTKAADADVQKKLNQIFYYIVSLKIQKANDLLSTS